MTTFSPPVTQSATQSDWGQSAVFLQGLLLQELAERLNVVGAGLLPKIGDIAGSGSLTLRRRQLGGLGYATAMTAMATETQSGTASSFTGTYSDVTVARHHLAYELGGVYEVSQGAGVDMELLATSMVDSYFKTLRRLMCVSGSGISASQGTSGAALDTDDWFALIAAFEETEGYDPSMGATAVLHPEQLTDLRTSLRSYTGFQFPEPTEAQQGIAGAAGLGAGGRLLGISVFTSHDVQTSGGDHVGFAFVPGVFGFATGDTSRIMVPPAAEPVALGEWGLLLTKSFNGAGFTNRIDANALVGVGRVNAAVMPQFKVLSINN